MAWCLECSAICRRNESERIRKGTSCLWRLKSHLLNQTCMRRFSEFITFLNRLFSTIFQDDDDTSNDESETESCTSDEHSVTDDDEVKTMTSWDDVRVGMLFIWNAFWMRLENTSSNVLKIDLSFTFFPLFFSECKRFFSVHWFYLCIFIHLPNIPAWRLKIAEWQIHLYVTFIIL